jgi:hypothetical protein
VLARFRAPLIVFFLQLASFGAVALLEQRLEDRTLRFTSLGVRLALGVAILLPLLPAMVLFVQGVRRRLSLGPVLALVGTILLGAAGGFALQTVLLPNWLFGPSYRWSQPAHDGSRIAHVYAESFLSCSYSVAAAPPGELFAEVVGRGDYACGTELPKELEWQPDGGVTVRLTEANRAVSGGLFLGPH